MLLNQKQEIQPIVILEMKDPFKIKVFRKKINLIKLDDPKKVYFNFEKDFLISKRNLDALIKADTDFKETTKLCQIQKKDKVYLISVYVIPSSGIQSIKYATDFDKSDEVTFNKDWVYEIPKPIQKEESKTTPYVVNGYVVPINKENEVRFKKMYTKAVKVKVPKEGFSLNLRDVKVGDKLTVFFEGKITNFINVTGEDSNHLFGQSLINSSGKEIKLNKDSIYFNYNQQVKIQKPFKNFNDFLNFTRIECAGRAIVVKTTKNHESLYQRQILLKQLQQITKDLKNNVNNLNKDNKKLHKINNMFKNR